MPHEQRGVAETEQGANERTGDPDWDVDQHLPADVTRGYEPDGSARH